MFDQPVPKLQRAWAKEISESKRQSILGGLAEDDTADATSHGGPGAGPFRRLPCKGGRGMTTTLRSACAIVRYSQSVRRGHVANIGGPTAPSATPFLTPRGGTRRSALWGVGGFGVTMAFGTILLRVGPPALAPQPSRSRGSQPVTG